MDFDIDWGDCDRGGDCESAEEQLMEQPDGRVLVIVPTYNERENLP